MPSASSRSGFVARGLRTTFGVVASVLLVVTLVTLGNTDSQHRSFGIVQATDAAATDSLRFRSQFRADSIPLAPVGQWAYANANGSVAQRNYSTNTQTRTQNNGACAYGGSGSSCTGSAARSDANVNQRPGNWDTDWGGLWPAAYVNFLANFTADVRCQANGALAANRPQGRVQYGNDSHLNGNGWAEVNIGAVNNGATYDHTFLAADGWTTRNTEIRMRAQPSWGTHNGDRRAWSQVTVNWTATQSNTPRTGSVTYRASCGMRMNDGSGGTTIQSAGIGPVTPMAVEHRETLTVEQDGEETVIEIDPETGEPVDTPETSAPASTTAESEAPESTTTTTPRTTTPLTHTAGPTVTTTPEVTETTTQRQTGTPRSSGFAVESELPGESMDYQVLSTRELTRAELDVVGDALAAAVAADRTRGRVDGADWRLFSGDGENRDIPVVEIDLADGAVVQLRPKIDGADLPTPDTLASEVPVDRREGER